MSRSLAAWLLCLSCGAGCVVPNAHLSTLPVYTTPGGFSETYHAALKRQEPLLWPAGDGVPVAQVAAESTFFGPMPPGARPPIEW